MPSDLRFWSPRRDSNPRPSDYESDPNPPAGPAQAHPRCSRAGPIPSRPVLCRLVVTPGLPERLPPCWVIRSMATHPEHRASDRDRMLKSDSNWERRGWSSGRVSNGTQQRVTEQHTPVARFQHPPRDSSPEAMGRHPALWSSGSHPGEWFPLVSSGLGSAVRSRANSQPDRPRRRRQ
jgi:hypothetical protein